MPDRKPRVGITIGDPAGIGPEIALRALQDADIHAMCTPVVFGSPEVMERDIAMLGLNARVRVVEPSDIDDSGPHEVLVVRTSGPEAVIAYGQINPAGGEAAVRAIRSAVDSAQRSEIDAICTCPLNKESMRDAGYSYDGHTEMLAEFTHSGPVSMLLMGRQLRVAHLTTHSAFRDVPGKITVERITRVIEIAHESMQRAGVPQPRIAVAGLNPHSGENGLFGREEMDVFRPAIDAANARGFQVFGPVSPDAVFIDMMSGKFDIIVVAYHDQGHIPVKLIERDHAVNVTGGLPIIRTSVDHGTAFDIAGKGIASWVNMKAALELAATMASATLRERS